MTMFIYLVEDGWDVPLVNLDPIVPQPRTRGMQFGNRMFGAAGNIIDDLPYVEFMWNVWGKISIYQSILGQFGLSSASSSEVTILIQDQRYNTVRKNGIAILPLIGEDGERSQFFLRDFKITVHSLRTST